MEIKPVTEIDDRTLILADVARKAMSQVKFTVVEVLTANQMEITQAQETAEVLATGRWTHDYPITVEEAQALKLPVTEGLPTAIYELMELYPQPSQRRPSVQYIPVPYAPQDGRGRRER